MPVDSVYRLAVKCAVVSVADDVFRHIKALLKLGTPDSPHDLISLTVHHEQFDFARPREGCFGATAQVAHRIL